MQIMFNLCILIAAHLDRFERKAITVLCTLGIGLQWGVLSGIEPLSTVLWEGYENTETLLFWSLVLIILIGSSNKEYHGNLETVR